MSLIQGNIRDVSRFNRVVSGLIELVNAPVAESPYLVTATSVSIQTDSNGFFEVTLGIGDYQLTIGKQKILFSVTEATGTFNIADLVTQDLVYTSKPYASNWNGLRQGNIQFLFVTEPDAPDAEVVFTDVPTGLHGGSVYNYAVSYVTSQGETKLSPMVSLGDEVMNPDGGPYGHILIPLEVNPANVITKRIWRNLSDEAAEEFYLLAEVAPSVESYEDSESFAHFLERVDAAIRPSEINTTAGGVYADDTLIFRVSPAGLQAGIEQRVSFDRSDVVQNGEFIGGFHSFSQPVRVFQMNVYCRIPPIGGDVDIVLQIIGTTVSTSIVFKVTLTPGVNTYTLEGVSHEIPAGNTFRLCVMGSLPNPEDYPGGISANIGLLLNPVN